MLFAFGMCISRDNFPQQFILVHVRHFSAHGKMVNCESESEDGAFILVHFRHISAHGKCTYKTRTIYIYNTFSGLL